MLAGEPVAYVFCELHEDYIVGFSDARSPVLVSVKHLEPDQPRWTLSALCNRGGVAHLYNRWRQTGQKADCLLQTNAGLRCGQEEAGGLRNACAEGDPDTLRTWATTLQPHLGEDCDRILAFLRVLRIEDRLPGREHLRSENLVQHLPRCLGPLGLQDSVAFRVYDAIVAEIEKASRNEIGDGNRPLTTDLNRLSSKGQLDSLLASKKITRYRLKTALNALGHGAPVQLQMVAPAEGMNRGALQAKLERGGVGPTGIRNAQNLRLNWISHREQWKPDLPSSHDPFDNVSSLVLNCAHKAENAARVPGSRYATTMLNKLEDMLDSTQFHLPGDPSADQRLLLGCAYQLTDECQIFWSDEFEIGS